MTPETISIAERIGQLLALLGTGGVAAFAWWRANRIPKPAPAPSPQHHPEAEQLREIMTVAREIQSTYRELRDIVQRNHAATTDDMREEARDIIRVLDRIESQLGRIEASQRVSEAMSRFNQPQGK